MLTNYENGLIEKSNIDFEEHFKALVGSNHDAIISKNLDGIIQSWNAAAEKIFGYTAAEAIGQSVTMLIPEGYQNEEPDILSRIRKGEKIDHYETVRRCKDGSLINISLTVSPIKNLTGVIIGASKIARDVTKQKQAEELERQFAAIIDSSDDAILSKDLNGVIRSWNRGAEKIFGYTAAEIIGKSVLMLIPEGHQNEEPDILSRIRKGQKIDHYETLRQRKDGSLINISLTVSPIKNSAGVIIGASKIARDVTEQKRIEGAMQKSQNALAQLNEELERRVLERTASLNEAITQMEEFSYSVSHDLRSPSRAMEAYARAVLDDYGHAIDEAGRGFLQKIVRNSHRMDQLIQDMLTYSRISLNKVAAVSIELGPLISDVIEQYAEMQPPRAVVKIIEPLPGVIAHEAALSQVFSNLLGNSVKFVAPNTVPVIEIRGEAQAGKARILIKDNGIGIDPISQSRLFGMFERLPRTKGYEGTGIGLAIVRKAVEKMGGKVGVESDGLNGSTFWIELPANTTNPEK